MFKTVRIIGHGRVGSAIGARLRERGFGFDPETPDVVLICVPDSAIASAAQTVRPGPWVAHVSGATPLAALDPHIDRFGLHPLQTFTTSGLPEQLDGAWAAITGETDRARARATWLAGRLGLQPFEIADRSRALYRAGAAMASNYLVTLHRAASELLTRAGAPPEALLPLMQRTMDNGFSLTGPIARGDWSTIDAHLAALRESAPELVTMYEALAQATAR